MIYKKSRDFAVRIIRLYQYLNAENHEYVLSKQLLRSGTSIGANCAEASRAQSKTECVMRFIILHSTFRLLSIRNSTRCGKDVKDIQ